MAHQRHFMERGLSVEDDIVVIIQVALDCVANLQMLVRAVLQNSQVNVASVDSLDVLCTGPVVSSAIDQSPQSLLVVLGDDLGHGQVHSDLQRHSELIQTQVRVRSDDRSRREVYSFTHQVTSETTFFTLQTRPNSLDRFSSLVLSCASALDVVIHDSGNIELEHVTQVLDRRVIVAVLDRPLNFVVHLDDLLVGNCQVILTAHGVRHGDRGSDGRWRYSQILYYHVCWVRFLLVQSHLDKVLWRDLF